IGYDLRGHDVPISIDLTLSAATAVADMGGNINVDHLETLLGATYEIDPRLQLFAGAGAGLSHGFGTPDARAMLGVRFTGGAPHSPAPRIESDRDGDGILDVAVRCPAEPE